MRNANHMRYSLVAWVSCWPSNDNRNLLAKKAAKWQMVNTTLCKSWQRPSICPPQPPHPPEERLQNSRAVHSNVENTTIISSEDKNQSRIMALAATALKRFQKLQNLEHMKMMNYLDPKDTWPIFMFIPASKCPSFRDAHISCSFHSHSSFSSI